MSGGGGSVLQAAVVAALAAEPALAGVAVFDAPPSRAAPPYAVVDEPVLTDWGAKGWTGREGTLAVLVQDAGGGGGERPVRLRALAGAVEAALPGLDAALGPGPNGGWRLATIRLSRSRITRAAGDRWVASVEWRVRIYRED
ncbi:DUF3168 domain-containing protein [uncultured Sphingomonas sp.]|uniref:DUF3168 domain-containing protein n=1 Tax=uncultured Sphingomonas sp. TaxID=158754 RepID=UPI0035CA3406